MSVVVKLDRELRPELSRFSTDQVRALRKKWRARGANGCKVKHKKWCYAAARRLDIHPKTVSYMMRAKTWTDMKPADHLPELKDGLFKTEQKNDRIDPDQLVKGGEIKISTREWSALNQNFSRGEIKKAIWEAITTHQLPIPTQPISQSEADAEFEQLCKVDVTKLVKYMPTVTRWDYRYSISDVVIDAPRTGNSASNFYHQADRWKCGYKTFPSPYDAWHCKRRMFSILNALWTLKFTKVGGSELRTAIAIRLYIASQFKPLAARTFYELFNAKRIYDPSSGWGDRVTGFMATKKAKTYVSTDPNSELYTNYIRQTKRYKGSKKIRMYQHGSEVEGGMKQYGHKVDTIFTSPPYFNAEEYSKDAGQSYKQYTNLEAWLEGFMFPTLENCWDILTSKGERGGILAMNISDIYDDATKGQGVICDPMNDYISKMEGARYIGCIGLRLAKRPQSGTLVGKKGNFIEPIWIWAKGGTWELEDYLKHGFKGVREPSVGLFGKTRL